MSPQQRLFRYVFAEPAQAHAYLQAVLPGDLARLVDWSTLKPLPNPAPAAAGLLFRVRFLDGAQGRLLLLLSESADNSRQMAFRVLRTVVQIWDRLLEARPQTTRLPLVIPVVISAHRMAWTAPLTLQKLLDFPVGHSLILPAYLPELRLHVEDLALTDEADLPGLALGQLALRLLKHAPSGRPWSSLLASPPLLQQAVQQLPGALEALLQLALEVCPLPQEDLSPEAIQEALRLHLGDAAVSAYTTAAAASAAAMAAPQEPPD